MDVKFLKETAAAGSRSQRPGPPRCQLSRAHDSGACPSLTAQTGELQVVASIPLHLCTRRLPWERAGGGPSGRAQALWLRQEL